MHRYLYCGADPVNKIDPSGQFLVELMTAITMSNILTAIPITTYKRTKDPYLCFEGYSLRLYKWPEVQIYLSWPAVSGKLKTFSKEDQARQNVGPIPEGKYKVDPKKIDYSNWWNPFDWSWVGFSGSWGRVRVPIEGGSNTYGRGGFFIHGGAEPGSRGCIDLWMYAEAFFDEFKKYTKPMDLIVNYSREVYSGE